MKKAITLILALILLSTLFLAGCGGKDKSKSSTPDPMAGVSKEEVAVQAMVAYYSGDLKSYLPVYLPEYETAVRMDILGYDYNHKDERADYLDRAKTVTQEQIDEWASTHFTQRSATYMDGHFKVTAQFKDEREVRDRDEYVEEALSETYKGTYSKVSDFLSAGMIEDVARVKVRVEFECDDGTTDDFGTNIEVHMVKINGAWKVYYSNLAGW